MAHENGDKQRPAKGRNVQGMLDETDPLRAQRTTDEAKLGIVTNTLMKRRRKGIYS